MKLINNIKNILPVLCVFAMFSCNDYFEEKPYDFVSPEIFYKTENECTQALTGIYSRLATNNIYGNSYSCMISNIDDLSYYIRNASQTSTKVFGNDHDSSSSELYEFWCDAYEGINNANSLLENIDNAVMDDNVRVRIKGEAKFLRAYFHFILAQAFLDIPLRDKTLEDINSHALAATPHKEVIDWVIKEMEECVDMVDDSSYDLQVGHVKKNTVMGILARVYLWRAGSPCKGGKSDYAKAAEWANKVKESNKQSLNPDVYAMWKNICSDKIDTQYNESIWEMEATGTRTDGTWTMSRIGNTIGNLQQNSKLTGLGYTYAFFAGSLILWDLYSSKDLRRDLSMAPYTYNSSDKMITWASSKIVVRRCGKYRREWETLSPKNKNWTPENYPILRYADVLLMIAEGENESNGSPTSLAYECINLVRNRAGLSNLANLSYSQFQQEVRDERGRELCFESLRRYDLVRWGIYVDAIHNKLGVATADSRWATDDIASGCKSYCARTGEKHQFFPIPAKELAVNTLLEQNSYWK